MSLLKAFGLAVLGMTSAIAAIGVVVAVVWLLSLWIGMWALPVCVLLVLVACLTVGIYCGSQPSKDEPEGMW